MGLFTFTKRGAVSARCDARLAYEVLTDYSSYSEWFPAVSRSKLLAQERDLAIAEFEFVHPPKDIFVVECIHTTNRMVLWRKLRGKVPLMEIQWDIESQGDQTKISLTLSGAREWPWIMRTYRKLTDAGRCVRALESYLSAYLPEGVTDESGEKVLEIAETPEGMICWLRGKKYALVPRSDGNA